MAGDSWLQIPSDLLDLDKTQQAAEQWASQQRATIANVWAQTQQRVIDALAQQWRQAANTVTAATTPPSTPGYNDMAGASSSPSFSQNTTLPGMGGLSPSQVTTPPTVTAGGIAQGVGDVLSAPGQIEQADLAQTGQDIGNLAHFFQTGEMRGPTNPTVLQAFQQTDATKPLGERLRDTLAAVQQPFQQGVTNTQSQINKVEPSGAAAGLYGLAANTVTNPLMYAGGAPTPSMLAGTGIGALGGAVLSRIQGATPEQTASNVESGGNIGMAAGPMASSLVSGVRGLLGAGQDVTTMFHGTGSAFETPEAGAFDPNGLFGPGYYLTSDPRVAASYATGNKTPLQLQSRAGTFERQLADAEAGLAQEQALPNPRPSEVARYQNTIDAIRRTFAAGPNTRAVNVPNSLKLLDIDQPLSAQQVDQVVSAIPNQRIATLVERRIGQGSTGENLYSAMREGVELYSPNRNLPVQSEVNQLLASSGYDGIRYNGGQRIPLADENGQPIQHTAVVIFPESLPKVTNAISGRAMGLLGADEAGKATPPGALGFVGDTGAGASTGEAAQAIPKTEAAPGQAPPPNQAPPTTGTTPPNEGEARAGNILLSKLPTDVQPVVQEAYDANPAQFEAARRGTISDAEVKQLADQVGTNADTLVKKWQPGQAQNAETLLALRQALVAKTQQVLDLQKTVAAGSKDPNDLLNFQKAVMEQAAIQEAVSGTTAEAGRALRQFRQSVTAATQSGDVNQMQSLLKKLGGAQWTQDLAQKLGQLDPNDALGRYQFIRDATKPKLANNLMALWYNSMLSSPHTLAVKTMSEALSLALAPVERAAAAAVEEPLAAIQGRPAERFFCEAPADLVGMAAGVPEGVNKGLFMLRHGYSLQDVAGEDFRSREAFAGPGAANQVASSIVNFPSRILRAGVEVFGSIAQAGALNATAYRIAKSEGLNGAQLAERMADLRANPTPALLNTAQKIGQYRVYQQPPGQIMQKFLSLRNTDFHGVPVLRFIVPFAQTPANLLKYGLERSPLAAFNVDMWKNVAAKNPEAADNIGRWLLGSAIGSALALEVGTGNITGLAPKTPAEKLAWEREGKQPNSIRIGDQWVSIDKVPMLSSTLLQVASLGRDIQAGKDVGSTAADLAASIGASLAQEPYLQGVSSLMQALNDPQQYGNTWLNSLAGSAVPSLVRVATQTADPTYRVATSPLQAIQAEVPGVSQQLPPRIGAFGEVRQRPASLISPLPTTAAHVSPVDAELDKYAVEPGLAGKTLRGIDLTQGEQSAYQQVSGALVKKRLDALVNDPRYQALSDINKAAALKKAITGAKDIAATQFAGQLIQQQGRAAILQRIAQKKAQRLPTPTAAAIP